MRAETLRLFVVVVAVVVLGRFWLVFLWPSRELLVLYDGVEMREKILFFC